MQRYEIVLISRENEMEFISIYIKKIIAGQNQSCPAIAYLYLLIL